MEDRLHKFAHLVDAGSFTAAAVAMHISQPALTFAINKLERELGVQLLLRGSRSLTVTAAGKMAYRSAKQLMLTTSNLATELLELAGAQPSAAIGLIDSLASMLFAPQKLVGDKTIEPDIFDSQLKLSIIVNTSSYLLQQTLKDEIDIAFITGQPRLTVEQLEMEEVGIEPLLLVCHPDIRTGIETQLRHKQPPLFISYDQTSTSYKIIQNSLSNQAIHTMPVFYSSSPEAMLGMVLRGIGMSVLPYFLVCQLLMKDKVCLVRYPNPIVVDRPISSVMRRGKQLPAGLATLPLVLHDQLVQQATAVGRL